jgi:endonuclease/exonuclease/phosphatase (EEP) superfamily protein YafD
MVMLGGKNSLRRNLVALLIAAPWLIVALARLFSLDSAWPLIPLVAFTPQTLLTILLPLAGAVVLRARWAGAAIVLMMVALAVVVSSRVRSAEQPLARGETVRIFTANLRDGDAEPAALAAAIRQARPDIISLQEAGPRNVAALRAAGILRTYPFREQNSAEGLLSNITLSRWPLVARHDDFAVTHRWPSLRVVGKGIEFYDFHSRSPTTPGRVAEWKLALASLPGAVSGGGERVAGPGDRRAPLRVIAGDFNATIDHRAFRALLARGYVDAGSVTGNGLDWTWSIGRLTRLVIDHVLTPPSVAVTSYRVVDLPGSDHNAVIVGLRLPG